MRSTVFILSACALWNRHVFVFVTKLREVNTMLTWATATVSSSRSHFPLFVQKCVQISVKLIMPRSLEKEIRLALSEQFHVTKATVVRGHLSVNQAEHGVENQHAQVSKLYSLYMAGGTELRGANTEMSYHPSPGPRSSGSLQIFRVAILWPHSRLFEWDFFCKNEGFIEDFYDGLPS